MYSCKADSHQGKYLLFLFFYIILLFFTYKVFLSKINSSHNNYNYKDTEEQYFL